MYESSYFLDVSASGEYEVSLTLLGCDDKEAHLSLRLAQEHITLINQTTA